MLKPLCLCLAAFLAVACATTSASQSGPLTLGIAGYSGAADAQKNSEALQAFLSQRLGRSVSAQAFPTQTALAAALADGKIDAAWMPPFAFVDAQAKAKVTPLAKLVRQGHMYYRGVLFMKADRKIDGLAGLQGTTVAWADKDSASGYLFPRATLVQSGLKPATLFGKEILAGDHLAVCKAVLEGKADVGATFADDREGNMKVDGCAQALGDDVAKQLQIVAVSAPIPNDVVAVRPGFSAAEGERIRQLFLQMNATPEGQQLLGNVFKAEKFAPVEEDDFEPVRFAAEVGH